MAISSESYVQRSAAPVKMVAPKRQTRKRSQATYAEALPPSHEDETDYGLPPTKPKSQQGCEKKRKVATATGPTIAAPRHDHAVIDLTVEQDAPEIALPPAKKSRQPKNIDTAALDDGERRLKRFRAKAPFSYAKYYERATTQRMFVVDRKRQPLEMHDCEIEEVALAGSTGNIYTVVIDHVPSCSCPSYAKGTNPCKHIIYTMVKVLKAPLHLQYQAALLTSELRTIFDAAGPLPTAQAAADEKDGKRKPIEGDCAICCDELVQESEEISWCMAACGNNMHKSCLDTWAASRKGQQVTCPYCRTPWAAAALDAKATLESAKMGPEGYVNIASQLGISQNRDYSTYHSFWVRREIREGRGPADAYDYEGDYD